MLPCWKHLDETIVNMLSFITKCSKKLMRICILVEWLISRWYFVFTNSPYSLLLLIVAHGGWRLPEFLWSWGYCSPIPGSLPRERCRSCYLAHDKYGVSWYGSIPWQLGHFLLPDLPSTDWLSGPPLCGWLRSLRHRSGWSHSLCCNL